MSAGTSSPRSRLGVCRSAVALAGIVALGGSACGSGEETCELGPYQDPAPHLQASFRVDDGASLHYLDFGGTGSALVFLAGAGDSAHVFDDFAPRFIGAHHVLALTRRGFGESSQPATGYEPARLAEDVVALLDRLGIERAHLAGHSIAGAEMTELAVRRPERVGKLIYLDAAYDWAASAAAPLPEVSPVPPGPSEVELASPEGFASYTASINGLASFPLAEVRATNIFDCGGGYLRAKTPSSLAAALADSVAAEHPAYASIAAPVLALFTMPSTVEDMFPWLSLAPEQRPIAEAYFLPAAAALEAQRAAFAARLPGASVEELESVPHFLFLAAPERVAATMSTFLGLDPG